MGFNSGFKGLIHTASTLGALNKIKGAGGDSSIGTVFVEIKLHFRHIYAGVFSIF